MIIAILSQGSVFPFAEETVSVDCKSEFEFWRNSWFKL